MTLFKTTIITLLMGTASVSMAESDSNGTGLFLEPGLSYQITNSNVDYPGTGANSSASTRGFGLLARVGVHMWDRFFIAADGRYALLDFNDNANNISVNATSWDIAPVIGMQMPENGPRLYVGYVVAGNLDPQSTNGRDLLFEQATGWRVGAGLKVQHVSVNIEWQRLHYGSNRLQSSAATVNGVTYNGEGLVASVTFPIDFN